MSDLPKSLKKISSERYLLQAGVRVTQSFFAVLFGTSNTSFGLCNLRLHCSVVEESYSSPDSRTHSLMLWTLHLLTLRKKHGSITKV